MGFLAVSPHLSSTQEFSTPDLERALALIMLSSLNIVCPSWRLAKIKQKEYEEGVPAHTECWVT